MARITESQRARVSLDALVNSSNRYAQFSEEVSSGRKVNSAGDSRFSGTINQYRDLLTKIEGHETRIQSAKAILAFQDNTVSQVNELLIRAKEVGAQAANETLDEDVRSQLAKEVWEIRDHLVQLANEKYQGRYIYGGADDDDAPFDQATYTVPASGPESLRYAYDNTTTEPGNAQSRTINLTDDFTMTVTTPGSTIFGAALTALEQLGRAMSGYSTVVQAGPVYTGTAYTFPTDYELQTRAIKDSMDALDTARVQNVMPERISLGAKLKRIDTAEALLSLTKDDAKSVLGSLQDANVDESATNLANAQTALNATYAVTAKFLQNTFLNYL